MEGNLRGELLRPVGARPVVFELSEPRAGQPARQYDRRVESRRYGEHEGVFGAESVLQGHLGPPRQHFDTSMLRGIEPDYR